MEQDDDKNIPSDHQDKAIDDSSAITEARNNADTEEKDKDDQNKDDINSKDKETIESAPDSLTTKVVEDSLTINTEDLHTAEEKIPEDELQDTGPPEPPSEDKEDPKSNEDSNILLETSEPNNAETQSMNPDSPSPDPQIETMEAEKPDSVSLDLPIESMDVENQDSESLDPQNENTELENLDSTSQDPQNTNTEAKSQDPDSSDLPNEDIESVAKISSAQEETEEAIASEKPVTDSETLDSDDKPDEIVAAESPRLKISSAIEDCVSESRSKISEDLEESLREKIDGDFEDSSSSIAEYQKYQALNNAEEKAEGDETTKKGDSGGLDTNFEQNQEKNVVVVEPENTEFVQISQEDKHDESQIENQSIDNAEDPFGGDNLNSENLEENMETDNLSEEIPDFQKLGDQADNLQDVVKAKDNFQGEKPKDDDVGKKSDISSDNLEKPSEIGEIDSGEATIDNSKQSGEKEAPREPGNDKEQINDQTIEKTNKEGEKILDKEGIPALDTDHVPSDVLPGQDDELCIIPDSMKVILPGETVEKEKESAKKVGEKDKAVPEKTATPNAAELQKNSAKDVEGISVLKKSAKQKESVQQAATKKGEGKSKAAKSTTSSTDLVINIDDESKTSEIEEIETKEKCKQCGEEKSCKIKVKIGLDCFNVCSKECRNTFKTANNKATDIPSDGVNSKREKRCAGCLLIVEAGDEKNLSWETMEFCNEECLGKFQTKYGSYCRNCNGSVQAVSLGKYCVRFGYDVRQFCCSTCLEEFKKGLKVCSYCQKDISSGTEGFLAPVGDKGQFKDFCTQDCMEKYSRMSSSEPPATEKKSCSVCQEEKIVHCEVQINGGGPVAICSDPCFAAFKFVNKVDPDQCSTCKKFFQLLSKKNFVVFYEGEAHMFCNKTCLNVFIITNRKIVPCNWCKVKKYNFDMIKKELKSGQVMMMCSLNCLTLYQVSINAVSARRINCDFCKEYSQAQYHLTMSDATIRNFCSYKCVMNFQSQYTKSPITIPSSDDPVPTGIPKRSISQQRGTSQVAQKQSDVQGKNLPVISSVTSLAAIGNGQNCSQATQQNSVNNLSGSITVQGQPAPPPQIIYKQQIIARPPSPVKVHNKMTQCKPLTHTKGVSVRPHPCTKSTQTEESQQIIVPIPVPIYVPYPMHMYSMPFPVPFPFPLPIPVPIFIPTTRNSAKGIFKDIKRIQEKIPADPFEAELLMMAEMVATEKKPNESDSDSEDDNRDDVADVPANSTSDGFSPEGVDSSNTFGDDMLQMALKMATGELDEPAVDLEAALTPNTITATQAPPQQDSAIDGDVQPERLITSTRGRKRMVPYKPRSTPSKRGRRVTGSNEIPLMPPPEPQPPPQPRIMEPVEKPDANMALKYTFGVNAWRQWVIGKNSELEKQSTPTRRVKLFKTELLQLTADELNYSLCLFVKEVRKPNGAEYAPDTIYYLCLGIQQYLFENNRIDNIFTDSYYEKFTDCLNDVAKKFSVLYNDAQYIVTRVEEEHLWESKQLGAHSPHVLLSTLMFFNTKHFNLVTVEEHMQLSFSHIMKHWKRNPAAQPAAVAGKVPGSRNVLLRFYPPQSALEANSRKKKVYEQQENEDNPLRCPVKLYEFYLSKCPESVKTRNDVFYLLPERSCVPDSPVWYSTSPLAKEHLIKMLYRVKMVKEINVALLTS